MNDSVKKSIVNTLGNSGEEDRFYVYALCEDDVPFYIGKGQGERIWQHEKETDNLLKKLIQEYELSEEEAQEFKEKHKRIIELSNNGKLKRVIIKWGLTEQEAFMAESALINLLKIMPNINLSNIANGHASKKEKDKNGSTAACLDDKFDHYPPLDIKENETADRLKNKNVVFININKFYKLCLAEKIKDRDKCILDSTRGSWIIGADKKPDYVFAVYQSRICGIYKVNYEVCGGKIRHRDITSDSIKQFPKFPRKIRCAEEEILKLLLKSNGNYDAMSEEDKQKCRKLKAITEDDINISNKQIEDFDKPELFVKEVSEEVLKKWLNRVFFVCQEAEDDIKDKYLSRIIRNGDGSIFGGGPIRYICDNEKDDAKENDSENHVPDSSQNEE
ncbi:MAG: GIY-YIG nuclease family protein [Oscillospiraceae bacterium]|nr:GIY-YIG nuclease family protein [Oscillospiraceae bacterium]